MLYISKTQMASVNLATERELAIVLWQIETKKCISTCSVSFNSKSAFSQTVHLRRKIDVSRSGCQYYGYDLRSHRKVIFPDIIFVPVYAELSYARSQLTLKIKIQRSQGFVHKHSKLPNIQYGHLYNIQIQTLLLSLLKSMDYAL